MRGAHLLLTLVVAQRIAELLYASRNERALIRRGGIETGRGHYPLMVLLHAGWLIAMAVGISDAPVIRWRPLLLFGALQVLRCWVVATLGSYWTTRIITVPYEPLIVRGPYRYLRHPNYLIVVGEIAILPLVFDQPAVAAIFSVVNLALLAWRVRQENAALAGRRGTAMSD